MLHGMTRSLRGLGLCDGLRLWRLVLWDQPLGKAVQECGVRSPSQPRGGGASGLP